jgi:hypothetical protein
MHATEEDMCTYFGEITKEQFEDFMVAEWDTPLGKKIFASEIVKSVKLTEIQ